MTNAPQHVAFEPTPLVAPVDRAAVRDWQRAHAPQSTFGISTILGGSSLIVAGLVFVWVFIGIAQIAVRSFTGGATGLAWPLIATVLVGITALGVLLIVWLQRTKRMRGYRLDHFARANHMQYIPRRADPPLPGMIFALGRQRTSLDLVRGEHPRFVEFANYRYTTGSGKNKTTHSWGYVAIKLDVPLPHIVLDAKGNNGFFGSNLPISLAGQQRLRLEGNFDEFFSLFCPSGYETDALYLFTPDIMARFVDHAAALDVEIVDDWLFLYARRDLVTLDPATWAWLFATVQALLEKLAQWARWRDDRLRMDAAATPLGIGTHIPGLAAAAGAAASTVPFAGTAPLTPPPGVAPAGRRLKRGTSARVIAIIGVLVFTWLLSQSGIFGAIVSGLFR